MAVVVPCVLGGQDKKQFWGKRRAAVGGKTGDDDDEDAADEDDEERPEDEEDEAPSIECPQVGGGRGSGHIQLTSLQPIVWHAIPTSFWVGMCHAFSGASIIDLTPGCGRLAVWAVTNQIPYVGICGTEAQKAHIHEFVSTAVKVAILDSASKIYSPTLRRDPEDVAAPAKAASQAAESALPAKAVKAHGPSAKAVDTALSPLPPKAKPNNLPKASGAAMGKKQKAGGGGGDDTLVVKKSRLSGGGSGGHSAAEELSPALAAMLAVATASVPATEDGEAGETAGA